MEEKRIVLIPAYEPEEVLLGLLKKMKSLGFEIVVVDDGSGKHYKEIFHRAADYAVVLSHTENIGKGCALKTGMEYIKNHYSDNYVVATMDADGQHKAADVKKVCEAAEKDTFALILGSRRPEKQVKAKIPFKSRFGNSATRMVYRLTTRQKLYDTQTGLRAFNKQLLETLIEIDGRRYEYEMNVLLECSKRKIPVKEIEIETIYLENNKSSHFQPLKDSYLIYKEILKFSLSSFIGFLVDYTLYTLLLFLTKSLPASNAGARLVSAIVNYRINETIVFKNQENIQNRENRMGKEVKKALYFVLATAILCANTVVLSFLVKICRMNPMLAKICTELFFFFFSWFIQRTVIFKKR